MAEFMDYRLALILPDTRQLLGLQSCGDIELPRTSIPARQRVTEQLTRAIGERWQIKNIVLDVLSTDLGAPPLAIVEVRSLLPRFNHDGLRAIDPSMMGEASLGNDERNTLSSILSGNDAGRGPFFRIGWVEEAQEWIRDTVRDRNIHFGKEIRQLNAGQGFTLVRFAMNEGPAYWLKAVGEPNQHEFQITKALAEHFPHHLPRIVAMRDDWNAWVMEETGHPLSDSFSFPSIEEAVVALAELQKESIGHVESLRAAGCLDRSIPVLKTHLGEITAHLEEAMARQSSIKVASIEPHRLRELEGILRAACSRMQDVGVPDALMHNDINAGNILICRGRCVFIDWAEAHIGNPFLTFQHICAQISRDSDHAFSWLARVKRAYRNAWIGWLTESQIDQAFALMPILAIASYLYGRGTWLNSPTRDDPQFQSYSRSLARYMDRAAQAPEMQEALCR